MNMHWFIAVETVKEKPVCSWNAFYCWDIAYVLYLLMYTNEETVRLMPTPGDIRNGVESQPLMITPHR